LRDGPKGVTRVKDSRWKPGDGRCLFHNNGWTRDTNEK